MNTRTVTEDQFELENLPAVKSGWQLWSVLAEIPAQFRNARLIERQARHFYAMRDDELGELGLTRATIAERLLTTYDK